MRCLLAIFIDYKYLLNVSQLNPHVYEILEEENIKIKIDSIFLIDTEIGRGVLVRVCITIHLLYSPKYSLLCYPVVIQKDTGTRHVDTSDTDEKINEEDTLLLV